MAKKLIYKDIEVGLELPALVRCPTTRQLVMWAGAVGEYLEIHYDKDLVRSQGLPDVVAEGTLLISFLGEMVNNWMGEQGSFKKIGISFRNMVFPGKDATCKGKITKKYIQDGEGHLECDVWVEDAEGQITTKGTAIVALPL